ncbi:GMC family oxidoreductase N-terminal domain-containing protein [Actinacidiphila glaucinigra]|uniref:hypothetical protein n=1 Tax=Actinacidiphila glaucinigra TaxID=235986 RepID=UPI003865FEDC
MSQAVEYNYVVVGAGTAGSVLTARLSEDGGARVLLLEAGGPEVPEAMPTPPAWPRLLGTASDWGDRTTGQAPTGTPVSGNTNATLYGIAERAAGFVSRKGA